MYSNPDREWFTVPLCTKDEVLFSPEAAGNRFENCLTAQLVRWAGPIVCGKTVNNFVDVNLARMMTLSELQWFLNGFG